MKARALSAVVVAALCVAPRLRGDDASTDLFVRTLKRSPVTGLAVRDSVFAGVSRGNRLECVLGLLLERVTFEPAAAN